MKLGGSIAIERRQQKRAAQEKGGETHGKSQGPTTKTLSDYRTESGFSNIIPKELDDTPIGKEVKYQQTATSPTVPPVDGVTDAELIQRDKLNSDQSKTSEGIRLTNLVAGQNLASTHINTDEGRQGLLRSGGFPQSIKEADDKLFIANSLANNSHGERQYRDNNPDLEFIFTHKDGKQEPVRLGDIANHPSLKHGPEIMYQWYDEYSNKIVGSYLAQLYRGSSEFKRNILPLLELQASNSKSLFGKTWTTNALQEDLQTLSSYTINRFKIAQKSPEDLQHYMDNMLPQILKSMQYYRRELGEKAPKAEAIKELAAMMELQFNIVQSGNEGSPEGVKEAWQNWKVPKSLAPPVPKGLVDKNGMVKASDAWPRYFDETVIEEKYQKILKNKIQYAEESELNAAISFRQNLEARVLEVSPYDENRTELLTAGIEDFKKRFGDRQPDQLNAILTNHNLKHVDYSDSFNTAVTKIKAGQPLNPKDLHRLHPAAYDDLKRIYQWDGKSNHSHNGIRIFEEIDLNSRRTSDDDKKFEATRNLIREGPKSLGLTNERDKAQITRILKYVNDYEIPQTIREVIANNGYTDDQLSTAKIWNSILDNANDLIVKKIGMHKAQKDPRTGNHLEKPMYYVHPIKGYVFFEESRGAIPGIRKIYLTRQAEQHADVNTLAGLYNKSTKINPLNSPVKSPAYKPEYFTVDPDGTVHDFWYDLSSRSGGHDPVALMRAAAEKNGYEFQSPIVTQGDGQQKAWDQLEADWNRKFLGKNTVNKIRANKNNPTYIQRQIDTSQGRPVNRKSFETIVAQTQSITNTKDLGEKFETEYIPKAVEFVEKNKLQTRAAATIAFIYSMGKEPQLDTSGNLIVPPLVKYMLDLQKSGGLGDYHNIYKGGLT